MIRIATREDIPKIYDLGTHLHSNYRKVNDLDRMFQEKFFKFFVAEENHELVAFLSATELHETTDIVDLYVLPEYRRQNIASRLINYLISDLSDEVLLITLEVRIDNEAAIKLYQKFGFEIICKRLMYYGNTDAYLMGLRCKRE